MKNIFLGVIILCLAGCVDNKNISNQPIPSQLQMLVERHVGKMADKVPLGACVAFPYPKAANTIPSSLSLLQRGLKNPSELTTEDHIMIYITPKQQLIANLDFIKKDDSSKQEGNIFSLSFDFVEYIGPIEEDTGSMVPVIAFDIGKLPKGKYKANITNGYLRYDKIGNENNARRIHKSRIPPDLFWNQIEFEVK